MGALDGHSRDACHPPHALPRQGTLEILLLLPHYEVHSSAADSAPILLCAYATCSYAPLTFRILNCLTGLSKCQRLCWRCATIYFKIVLWSSGCPYTVEGLEQLDPNGNYFFASNHESLWDVPLIFAGFPPRLTNVSYNFCQQESSSFHLLL